jgi:pimeloyl-ACP methyl ester carboxylesterase
MLIFRLLLLGLALTAARPSMADDTPAYGPELQGFDHPFPVLHYRFDSQGDALDMAYMDVPPEHPNGRTAVLLHGKNFCAATWQASIGVLTKAGYRVIAPDQIGFCKSGKPEHYQFSFKQLAGNTHALLTSLGIARAIVIGHSTGGMLAVRYGLMYLADTDRRVLVDPIGLEDWKAKGVPWQSVDAWYRQERETSAESIRTYERATYYAGTTTPGRGNRNTRRGCGCWQASTFGPGRDAVARDSALLYDMIYTQPVVYELPHLGMPVLLIIGDKDTTAIGKNLAPAAIRPTLGNYPVLGREAAAAIPNATLKEFADLGHAPQIEAPDEFHAVLLEWLTGDPAR